MHPLLQVVQYLPARNAAPTASRAVPPCKKCSPHCKLCIGNRVIPKLSPKLSPRYGYALQNMHPLLQEMQSPLQNAQYLTARNAAPTASRAEGIELSPSYPQSYPQDTGTPCKKCTPYCKMCSSPCKMCSTSMQEMQGLLSYPQCIVYKNTVGVLL